MLLQQLCQSIKLEKKTNQKSKTTTTTKNTQQIATFGRLLAPLMIAITNAVIGFLNDMGRKEIGQKTNTKQAKKQIEFRNDLTTCDANDCA